MYIGSSIGQYEVYWNKWRDLLRSRVLSGKHIVSCNDCLMDFKDDINDVTASLVFDESTISIRSTVVKFGIPFGPVLKHGPRSLSSMRVNG